MTRAPGAVPVLTAENLRTALPRVEELLARHATLVIPPLESGLYAASGGQPPGAPSGYQHAWIRDNVMVARARWQLGDVASAARTSAALGAFLATQVPRMEAIIARPALKEDVQRRPAVRFDARTLGDIGEPWAHAQNDALAHALWLRAGLALHEGVVLDASEAEVCATLARYFRAIEYWADEDSGAWEEGRKVNASSVGAVVAALQVLARYRASTGAGGAPSPSELASAIAFGWRTLDRSLPFESPPAREADAALLFLVEPLDLLPRESADAILALVGERLMGPYGIRRYVGDSYFCQDYDTLFPPEQRSANFSEDIAARDALLRPGSEAQWCLFDPLLSAIFGRRFQQDRTRTDALEEQLRHANRALAQLTPDFQCPELYFLKGNTWVPNEHTPLAWTQANLAVAVHALRASAA